MADWFAKEADIMIKQRYQAYPRYNKIRPSPNWPSEARYQETDAEIRELMSESGIGWPMFDREEDEEPPPSYNLKASRFATGQ